MRGDRFEPAEVASSLALRRGSARTASAAGAARIVASGDGGVDEAQTGVADKVGDGDGRIRLSAEDRHTAPNRGRRRARYSATASATRTEPASSMIAAAAALASIA